MPTILETKTPSAAWQTVGNQTAKSGAAPEGSAGKEGFWGADGFTFGDVLDMVNPLQHIPVLSSLYRAVTGDEISPGARVAGGGLLGGPLGLFASIGGAIMEEATGKDAGGHLLAALSPGGAKGAQYASAAYARPEAAILPWRTRETA